jgi:hypothetical protein
LEDEVMTTPVLRFVGILGLVCWLGMIGWVAKTSRPERRPGSALLFRP